MDVNRYQIVSSLAGRDKGRLFIVMEIEPNFVYLVDGKLRKIESPKKKRRKHVAYAGVLGERILAKLTSGEKVLNSEIRRALAEFSNDNDGMPLQA
ncbi:MAG: KOW domain-containing RNA-binding protein [Clostridia bacterium]|nr:KOW domain-containing RNA-binding protein [Clostridia bacterium]